MPVSRKAATAARATMSAISCGAIRMKRRRGRGSKPGSTRAAHRRRGNAVSKRLSPPAVAEVRLRAAADADLASILDYSVARFGEEVGEAYLRSFEGAFDLLRRHPIAGALRLEI